MVGLRKFRVMSIIGDVAEELGSILAIDENAAVRGVLTDCPILVMKMVIVGSVIEECESIGLLDKNTSFVASPGYIDDTLCWIVSVVKTQPVRVSAVGASNTHSKRLIHSQLKHLVNLGSGNEEDGGI